jgi:hypothetical protein
MILPKEEIGAFEEGVRNLDHALLGEEWHPYHDLSMQCRDLQERIEASFIYLDRLSTTFADLRALIAAGSTLDLDRLLGLRRVCRKFFIIRNQLHQQIAAIEEAGFKIDRVDECRGRIETLFGTISPVSRVLESSAFYFPLPDAETEVAINFLQVTDNPRPGDDPEDAQSASGAVAEPPPYFELLHPGTGAHVKARPGRLPPSDPPFETGEGPAPFDLPVLGPRRRATARPGRLPLPDPIDFEGL